MSGYRFYEAGMDPGLYEVTGPVHVRFCVDHKVVWEKNLRAGDRFIVHGRRSPMRTVHELRWEAPENDPPVRVVDQYRASPGNVLAAMTLVDAFEFLDRSRRRAQWQALRDVCDEIARILESQHIPSGPAASAPLPPAEPAAPAVEASTGPAGRRMTIRARDRKDDQ